MGSYSPGITSSPTFTDITATDLHVTGNIDNPSGQLTVADNLVLNGQLDQNGSQVGFYGAATVIQAAAIIDAAGGVTVDNEARTAINAALQALRDLGLVTP